MGSICQRAPSLDSPSAARLKPPRALCEGKQTGRPWLLQSGRETWPLHSSFPDKAARTSAWAPSSPRRFPAAKAVFDEVDAALGQKLSQIMWEGPKETLTLTANAQPALMAHSMAVMRVLEAECGLKLADKVKYVAGHSLGEYAALAAAGTFSIGDAARLLRIRGEAMQKAVPVGVGAMAALLGVGLDVARKVAAEAAQGDVCDIANDNEPTQVVLSGHKTAIDRVAEVGKKHGVRRALPLPVSAPFHCSLMKPAADAMAEALAKVDDEGPRGAGRRATCWPRRSPIPPRSAAASSSR